MALTGQTASQVPHFMHLLGSIQAFPSLKDMASTGHIFMQVPQDMHFFGSTILN